MKRSFGLLLFAALSCANIASAQKRTVQGFETDCAGTALNVDPFFGTQTYPANTYAGCGLASVVTGEANMVKIVRSAAPFGVIPGVSGLNALVGAYDAFNPSTITITFAPAVNELSFNVLEVDRAGMRVVGYDAANNVITDDRPGPADSLKKIAFSRSSTTPITRVVITYPQPGGLLATVDKWYIDDLTFNAWVCGDGELDGPSEACDDGNKVQCDGCSNTCTPTIMGCSDGASGCVPSGIVGCTVCDLSQAPGPTGDILRVQQAVGATCDDTKKCTITDACDATGTCTGNARNCDDGLSCTSDSCSEASADGCVHDLNAHSCLIEGRCYRELDANPANACQVCDPARSTTAWSAQANTVRCTGPSCVGGMFTAAALCDGAGTCGSVTPISCGNFLCATTTSCTESCADDRECAVTSHCDKPLGKCVDNLIVGTACLSSAQCAAGLACADGVCCDSACGSKCETCRASGFVGKCTNITFGDPDNECAEDSQCASGNQCVKTMTPAQPSDAGVPPGNNGNGSNVLPIGARCDRNDACGLGFCKDGVCCDSPCDGVCQGCNVLGSTPGQCTPYSLGTDPENECIATAGVCGGDRSCTQFETRGNGLCSFSPSQPGKPNALLALAGLVLALCVRRRRR